MRTVESERRGPLASASAHRQPVDRRARVGALGVLAAVLLFAITLAFSLRSTGTLFVWAVNMISDLGDGQCGTRGGRWICSPGFALFNTGLVVTGVLLGAAGACLLGLWGRLLGGSVLIMGLGLIVAAAFPAGDAAAVHLAGVVLALVVPGLGFLLSAIRPGTAWLRVRRVPRGVLGGVALIFCAENRLPGEALAQAMGQVIIVGCLLLALLAEAARVLLARPAAGEAVSR